MRSCVFLSDHLANEGDQFGAILLSVLERFIAANEQAGSTELVVGEQRLGDSFRIPDERRRVASRSRDLSELRP